MRVSEIRVNQIRVNQGLGVQGNVKLADSKTKHLRFRFIYVLSINSMREINLSKQFIFKRILYQANLFFKGMEIDSLL